MKTVNITWTTAPRVRMTARVDLPEYGIAKDQTFYLVRSSKDDGTYYIVTWNESDMMWNCTCPARVHNCRHVKLVNIDCQHRHTDPHTQLQTRQLKARRTCEKLHMIPAATLLSKAMNAHVENAAGVAAVIDKMTNATLNGNRGFSLLAK